MLALSVEDEKHRQLKSILTAVEDFQNTFFVAMQNREDIQLRLQVIVRDSRVQSVKVFRERTYELDGDD